jgi:hypothetical protein
MQPAVVCFLRRRESYFVVLLSQSPGSLAYTRIRLEPSSVADRTPSAVPAVECLTMLLTETVGETLLHAL